MPPATPIKVLAARVSRRLDALPREDQLCSAHASIQAVARLPVTVVQAWISTIAVVDLSAWLDKTAGRRYPVAAVGVVKHGEISVAARGAGVDADYEIGSISKGITGLLHIQALDRGEITADSVLADFLPLGDVPAGGVTLSSIVVHR